MQPKQSPGRELLLLAGLYACCMFAGQFIAQVILLNYSADAFGNINSINPMLILGVSAIAHFCTHIVAFLFFLRVAGYSFQTLFPKTSFKPLILVALPVIALLGIMSMGVLSAFSLSFFESYGFYGVVEQEAQQQETIMNLLTHQNPAQLGLSLVTLCLLPAVGEEFIFRGILQSRIMAATHDRHFSVIIASLIFSAIHLQPVNILSIALLGLALGYLYSYTKNIWYAVILHFLVNAVQVVQLYFWPDQVG